MPRRWWSRMWWWRRWRCGRRRGRTSSCRSEGDASWLGQIGHCELESEQVLARLYIDNYRCFVNFEFGLASKQLILGLNGAGKSAFLEVLRGIRDFALVGCKA